ncbi:UNVERIFIED_CONTAM: hypothetical protein PYX00_011929 [Menopon gallinae]|uniref:exodeoxyribonuclease III n=1 Tax=Menopon gallinae TaxID=328185 RepID=A0AAW2H936_9NEOP
MQGVLNLISWNVNGLRAIARKNFFPFLHHYKPDILALQEIKAEETQLGEEFNIPGYFRYLASSTQRKGYSGVAIYSRLKPLSICTLSEEKFKNEGRSLIIEYNSFFLINAYFPNSQDLGKRLGYKLEFLEHLSQKVKQIRSLSKHVIVCGDYNIAHRAIDLSHPEANVNSPGFLKEEREWMDSFLQENMIDTFRYLHPQKKEAYSWWSYRTKARQRNIGWRIDYFCVNNEAKAGIKDARILQEVLGSDHCPVQLLWQVPQKDLLS